MMFCGACEAPLSDAWSLVGRFSSIVCLINYEDVNLTNLYDSFSDLVINTELIISLVFGSWKGFFTFWIV